jgi:hypothetical protein
MASWSRSPNPIGRIWRILCFGFFVGLLWWQEWCLARDLERGISINKAVLPIFWRLVVLVLFCGTGRLLVKLSVKLARWKLDGHGGSGMAFFNKQTMVVLFFSCSSFVLLLPLDCRGGEGLEDFDMVGFSFGRNQGKSCTANLWSSSSVASQRPTQSAGGQRLRALMQTVRQVSDQPPWRRPFEGFLLAFIALAAPSGSVPGAAMRGRQWSSFYGGEDGPDCFSCNLSRVLSVIFEDCFVISFFSGFLCTLYSHRQN